MWVIKKIEKDIVMKKLKLLFLFLPLLTLGQTIELKGIIDTSNFGTDVWEYIDEATGNVYAIVGGDGIAMIDVTDPTAPFETDHLPTVPGFDVKIWSHYAYCATGGGGTGRVVDLSDPTNIVSVGSFPSPHNIYIDERGYMYNSSPGVRIYDLNPDPTNPQFLIQVGSQGHDVTVRGNIMIDAHGGSGTNLYDVTDPASPLLLSTITDPTISYHHQGDISEDGNYLYICDELGSHPQADISVWDISTITAPFRVSDVADPNATPHNMYVIGDYAYASYYSAGFKVFDISDPSELVIADVYDTHSSNSEGFNGAFGVYPSRETANIYINDRTNGIFIFGFSELLSNGDISENSFEYAVYPNPTTGVLTINTSSEINDIALFDVQGRQLLKLSNQSILGEYTMDLTAYTSGIYFIAVNNKQTKKIVLK